MAQSTAAISISRTFAYLRHPNYRLWFIGQPLSLVGTWMQNTAQGYLIYELTGSALYLGLVSFAAGMPTWLFTLYGGVIADRIPRRRLLLITQTPAMLLAFILAVLVLTDIVQPWMILILAFLLGTVNAFEAPVRISFVRELVSDREDMPNAIALMPPCLMPSYRRPSGRWIDLCRRRARVVLHPQRHLIQCCACCPGSMHITLAPAPIRRVSAISQTREGFAYVLSQPVILYLMIGSAFLSICGFGIFALMPAWAKDVMGVTRPPTVCSIPRAAWARCWVRC